MRSNPAFWCVGTIVLLVLGRVAVAAPPDQQAADGRGPAGDGPTRHAPIELDDVPQPFVPAKPETDDQRNKVEALGLFAAGRTAEQAGNFAGALRLYQRALQHDSKAMPILRQVMEVARALNRKAEFMRYALIAVELDPSDLRVVWEVATQLTEQNDFESAIKLYEQGRNHAKTDKKSAEYLLTTLQLGGLYWRTEKLPQAAQAFAEIMQALDKPEEYALDAAARKSIVGDPAKTYELFGEAFLGAGRNDEALHAFEKLQAVAPRPASFAYHRAQVFVAKKEFDKALTELQIYFDAKVNHEQLAPYELLKTVLEKQGRTGELIGRLEKIYAADRHNVPLAYFLGIEYRQNKDWAKAEPLYRDLLQRAPKAEAYRGLLEVYRQTDQPEPLLETMTEAVEKTGGLDSVAREAKTIAGDKKLLNQLILLAKARRAKPGGLAYGGSLALAVITMDAKRYDEAGEFFEACLLAKPKAAAELYVTWAVSLVSADEYTRAASVLRRAIDAQVLPANNPVFHTYLAVALEMAGKTDEALAAARKALELGDDTPRLEMRVGWVLLHAKRYDEAAKIYREIVRKFDGEHTGDDIRRALREVRLSLSNIYVATNDIPQAEEWLEQVLDEFPDDISALNDLGYLWADQGKNLERALKMIQQAVAAEPDNYAYRDSLGWVFFRLKRYDEAVVELKKAAAQPDVDGVVLEHLGDAHQACQQQPEAREAWQRALASLKKQGEPGKVQAVEAKLREHGGIGSASATPSERKAPSEPAPPTARPQQ